MRHKQLLQFTERSFQQTREGWKMILPNKHITKHQVSFDLIFLATFFFSTYICLETTIKLLSLEASMGKKFSYKKC